MAPINLKRAMLLFVGVALLFGGASALTLPRAFAQDPRGSVQDTGEKKDKPALAGVWVHTERELKIEFSDKDVLKISPRGKDEEILVLCKYTAGKEGLVKAKITAITALDVLEEAKVKELLPIGLEFSFTWRVKSNTATLDNVKNVEVFLKGKYNQKKYPAVPGGER